MTFRMPFRALALMFMCAALAVACGDDDGDDGGDSTDGPGTGGAAG